eukprot:15344959-Ditylum_brightwellii.AAC.1
MMVVVGPRQTQDKTKSSQGDNSTTRRGRPKLINNKPRQGRASKQSRVIPVTAGITSDKVDLSPRIQEEVPLPVDISDDKADSSPSQQRDVDAVLMQEEVLSRVKQLSHGVEELSPNRRILARKPQMESTLNTSTPKLGRKRGKEQGTKMMSPESDSNPKAKVARKTALGVKRKGTKARNKLTYSYHDYISEESNSLIEEVPPRQPPLKKKK